MSVTVVDTRRARVNWTVADGDGAIYPSINDGAVLAVLMDLRDALDAIVRRLDCIETRAIPGLLRQIADQTKPKKPTRRKP